MATTTTTTTRSSSGGGGYAAVVVGATGAVGRELVAELVASPACARVVALCRRELPPAAWPAAFPRLDAAAATSKLEVRAVDFDHLAEGDVPRGDAAFCCLGTTRKDAGSAEAFRKVDLEYVTRFGQLTRAANVPYFGLLTASNANARSWFLYPQTKGEAENAIRALAFARTSIFRPGLIDRGELARGVERVAMYVVPSITAVAIARGMVADYEKGPDAGLKEWTNAELKQFE